jgi:hypothetical protein
LTTATDSGTAFRYRNVAMRDGRAEGPPSRDFIIWRIIGGVAGWLA